MTQTLAAMAVFTLHFTTAVIELPVRIVTGTGRGFNSSSPIVGAVEAPDTRVGGRSSSWASATSVGGTSSSESIQSEILNVTCPFLWKKNSSFEPQNRQTESAKVRFVLFPRRQKSKVKKSSRLLLRPRNGPFSLVTPCSESVR